MNSSAITRSRSMAGNIMDYLKHGDDRMLMPTQNVTYIDAEYTTTIANQTDIYYRREKEICDLIKSREVTVAEIIACIIAIFTVLENAVILIAISRGHRSLRKPPFWFIASLSLADLLTGVEVVMAIFIPIGDDPRSRIVLKGLAVATFIVSVNSLLLVSMDRYLRIVRYSDYHRILNRKIIIALILGSWIFSFGIFLVAPLMGWSCGDLHCCAHDGLCTCMRSTFGDDACGRWCSQSFVPFTKSYILTGLIYFAVSISVMTSFYYVIFKMVKEKTLSVENSKRRDVQLAKTLVLTLGIFVVCWLPVQGLFIVDAIVLKPNGQLSKVFDYALIPSVVNSFMNPIIYSIRMPRMRESALKVCLPCIYGSQQNGSTASTTEPMFRKFSSRGRRQKKRKSTSNSSDIKSPTPRTERGRLMSSKSFLADNSVETS